MSQQRYQRIYQTVKYIPPGKVATYGQIADLAGLPNRARLVGKALAESAHNSSIPWHRVVNAKGRISLPQGSAAYLLQQSRLQQEGVVIDNGRSCLADYAWQVSLEDILFKLSY
ncbi:methylated-DNA--[protein]-cysteine S-methyltransferase [Thalassotalea ponticola]|uniref:MGMT family protein n=1 Tax=Thalassotalea ponticola TaxID=1523392 RepID=UPI0025B569D5|nr:methylated-DNA--[protein]-cysteine S-methyltransferase [Thalassotalea ponticola]MDN3653215.1 methylated-DNA--[protein]-cysteine S-methyltransferase [Thalassotalea ponticola]